MDAPQRASTRRRVVVDNRELALRIGGRLRTARTGAKMTQSQLAGERYTKAYVSALETGIAKPSMAALTYFADRLGVPPTHFLSDDDGLWPRLQADLALAAGKFQEAIDAYQTLLELEPPERLRGELLAALAEAYSGVDRHADAIAAAAEAVRLLDAAGRRSEAAIARYWLASGLYSAGNYEESSSLLRGLLAAVRDGLRVEPDFEARILMALAAVASKQGQHAIALSYLEEVRGVETMLDDRRRGAYLYDLAYSYRETGDVEAAVRAATASLALFRAAGYEYGVGALENDLALSFLALSNVERARGLAESSAQHFERLGDQRWLAHVHETQAQIALARGDLDEARRLALSALSDADATTNDKAAVSSLRTLAKVERAAVVAGRPDAPQRDFSAALAYAERAAQRARAADAPLLVREALTDLGDLLIESGEATRGAAAYREALQAAERS